MTEHLYGSEEMPFTIGYINYIGKPLYKLSKKVNLPRWASLAVANIPGSAIHSLAGYKNPLLMGEIFIISEILCNSLMYLTHRVYKNRRIKLKSRLEKII
jgi:hypothetical protein